MGHSRKCLFQQTWQLLKDNIKTLASKTNTKYCTCFIFPEVEPWHHVSMIYIPQFQFNQCQPSTAGHTALHTQKHEFMEWGDWIMSIPQRPQSSSLTKTDKPTGGCIACGWAQWKPRIATAVLVSLGPNLYPSSIPSPVRLKNLSPRPP